MLNPFRKKQEIDRFEEQLAVDLANIKGIEKLKTAILKKIDHIRRKYSKVLPGFDIKLKNFEKRSRSEDRVELLRILHDITDFEASLKRRYSH